jgi:hypothetical protein
VLAVTGPHATQDVMDAVHRHLPKPHDPFLDLVPGAFGTAGIKLTPRHYAYLKISEGCNHRCTFCIIPSMRGDLVSRPIGDVLKEAKALFEGGVKELLVISQDTSAYGVDVKYRTGFWDGRPVKTRLLELVQALSELAAPHGAWVRLHYVYPYPSVDEIVPLMAEGKLLPYLDVPFQHSHPEVLRRMKRPASGEKNLERIERWRAVPRHRDPLHLHRRLSGRDRGRVRGPAGLHARAHRPRGLLCLFAGRGRGGQRAGRPCCPPSCARSAAHASWPWPSRCRWRNCASAWARPCRCWWIQRPRWAAAAGGAQLRRRARDRRRGAAAAAREGQQDAEGGHLHPRASSARRATT